MLRHVQLSASPQIETNPNRFCSCSQSAWFTVIAALMAFGVFTSPSIGQEVLVDPPTADAAPAEQEEKPAETGSADADETKTPAAPVALKTLTLDLRDKELSFKAPKSWKAKKPTVNFMKHKLILPKAEGEEKDAQMTFTIASGSTQDNINRWKAQFKFPNGAAPDKVFAMEKKTVAGYELTSVQLRGTFMDTMAGRGPFAGGKKTPREDYMMKAVIISPEGADATTPKCFIKLVGSEKTLKQHVKAYEAMVKSMKTQAAVE